MKANKVLVGLIFLTSQIILICAGCAPKPDVQAIVEDAPEPEEILIEEEPTHSVEIAAEPTPTLDFSEWYIQIGEMQCGLELFGDAYPERFVAVCPEEVWLPISQITQVDVVVGEVCLDQKSAEDFADVIEKHFPGVMQIEFLQTEDGNWGCQVPYSDRAGIEVVCGIGCEGIAIFLSGKTIRNFSGGSAGSGNSERGSVDICPQFQVWDPELRACTGDVDP